MSIFQFPKGYKQTEVGVIPEAWEVMPIISCCEYADYRGKTPPKTRSGTFLITARNVRRGFIDYEESQEYVATESYEQIMRRGKPRIGDVLITTEAPLGNVAQVDRKDVALAQRIIKYRPRSDDLSSDYLKHYLLSDLFQTILINHGSGSTATGIKGRVLHQLPVVIPPPDEQRAIAGALSDVDGLIGALDRLIAKKRDLKQAAMQQLLTGQTRLPGFHGEWEVKQLATVCSMKSGEGITSANIDQFSKYPCYGGNGLRGFTSSFTHDGSYALIGRQGALCGNVYGVEGKFFASEHAIVVTAFAQTDIRWLTYVLGRMNLNQYSESSAQPGLSVSKILKLDLFFPPTKAEQTAIARVLSDLDAELAVLERRREKTRALKQGMMQELLTGRVRLR